MNSDTILENIRAGKYKAQVPYPGTPRQFPADYIFDEEKTVRWNREEVKRKNREAKQELNRYKASVQAGHEAFKSDVIAMLQKEYSLSEAQASLVFTYAYERGHSDGHEEVFYHAQSYGEFAEKILDADNED